MTKKVKKEVQVILFGNSSTTKNNERLAVVRSGYARNYLIPQKKARIASLMDVNEFNQKKIDAELQEKVYVENCLKHKSSLEKNQPYLIQKKTGENNKIFGKLTIKQVKQTIEEKTGVDLETASIELPEIKQIGKFPIIIKLHSTVQANVTLDIISQ